MLTGENLGDYMKQPKLNEIKLDEAGTIKIRARAKKSTKVKITINLDAAILNAVRQRADETGIPYQNLVNRLLANALAGQTDETNRIDRIEKEIKNLKKKLSD